MAAAAQYAICRAEEEKPLPLADKEKAQQQFPRLQLCAAVVPSLSPPALGTGNRGAGDSRLNLYGIGLTLPKNAKWKLTNVLLTAHLCIMVDEVLVVAQESMATRHQHLRNTLIHCVSLGGEGGRERGEWGSGSGRGGGGEGGRGEWGSGGVGEGEGERGEWERGRGRGGKGGEGGRERWVLSEATGDNQPQLGTETGKTGKGSPFSMAPGGGSASLHMW